MGDPFDRLRVTAEALRDAQWCNGGNVTRDGCLRFRGVGMRGANAKCKMRSAKCKMVMRAPLEWWLGVGDKVTGARRGGEKAN